MSQHRIIDVDRCIIATLADELLSLGDRIHEAEVVLPTARLCTVLTATLAVKQGALRLPKIVSFSQWVAAQAPAAQISCAGRTLSSLDIQTA